MTPEMRVAGELPGVYAALYRDLAEAPERAASLFPRAPAEPAAWRARAAEVEAVWSGDEGQAGRRALVAALRSIVGPLSPKPAQLGNLDRLARQDALVVVTGQQAGLLGGPLFTTYKALGAVTMAAAAERELGCPVVPVFWVASEDHDWSEVSRQRLSGPDGAAVQLALPGSGDFRSAGDIPVPVDARHLVGELEALFPPAPAGWRYAESLRDSLRSGGRLNLASWFTRQLHVLFAHTGLLFYDPMLPALRALAAPVFARAADRAPAANAAIAEAGARMRAAGYAPGLDLEPDHVHLFCYHNGMRLSLHAHEGRVRTKGGEVDLSPAALAEAAAEEPARFSPNVALRPIVQEHTLPVLAQIGGPGEAAYLAQVGAVFPLWDRAAPIVSPRPGGTVVLPEDRASLARAGAAVADVRGADSLERAIERVASAGATVDLDSAFAAEREAVDARYATLERELEAVSPHLPAIVRRNADRVRYEVAYLEGKAHQHRRRAHREAVGALRGAASRLFPGGALQERSSLIYPYVFRWGTSFLDAVAATACVPGTFGRHLLLDWLPEG